MKEDEPAVIDGEGEEECSIDGSALSIDWYRMEALRCRSYEGNKMLVSVLAVSGSRRSGRNNK